MQIRQGDVLLVRVDDDPEHFLEKRRTDLQSVPRERGRLVLAHGEATGHAHVVESEDATLVSEDEAEELFLLVHGSMPVPLVHEEHETLDVPPGAYRVVRQREYRDPDEWDEDDWDFVND
jgi:hypothetical protein